MEFFDDFEDPAQFANYTDVDGVGFGVAGGVLFVPDTPNVNHNCIRNGFSPSGSAYIKTAIATAMDCGLVLRYVDDSNHYMLALRDDSGTAPTSNLQLYRKVSGTYVALDTLNIVWPRGTVIEVALVAIVNLAGDQTLEVYLNGARVITRADNTHLTGGLGVRGHRPPSEFLWLGGGDYVPPSLSPVDAFRGFSYPQGVPTPPFFLPTAANPIHNGNTILAGFEVGGGGGVPTNPTHGYATTG